MKSINTLLNSQKNKRVGNHWLKITHTSEEYYYHFTCICKVNHKDLKVVIKDGGYQTSSTTRAINCYLRSDYIQKLVNEHGYELIDTRG